MGIKYFLFRVWYVFQKQTGLMKIKFPAISRKLQPDMDFLKRRMSGTEGDQKLYNNNYWLNVWRNNPAGFFFQPKESLNIAMIELESLKSAGEKILDGEVMYFYNQWIWLGKNYDWVTNPKTGYLYDIRSHWSMINELDHEAGDIKFVWEKSRFSYLLTLIRYDYHFNVDCSQFVLEELLSWIARNPINRGPNWICSQEISIRLMNWYFALGYYMNSPNLTPTTYEIILQSVYYQVQHVYSNIRFSLTTVRNNHALTESLLLYLTGHLFPFIKGSAKWRMKGKKWFQQEINYQIYDDGSYIQFSMNYHRVAIQLLTVAILFAEKEEDAFDKIVYDKAKSSLNFLYQFHNKENGTVTNYGHNDGALFFPLNNLSYSDFRPQLNALNYALYKKHLFEDPALQEDAFWLGAEHTEASRNIQLNKLNAFDSSGYYSFRNGDTFTFLRCGKHRNRPGQADNLHIDISINNKNLFRDAGTFQYNANPNDIKYFFGTQSHNTVMLGDMDQMKKVGRFIWLYWSQAEFADLREEKDWIIFEGQISAFRHIRKNIRHHRFVRKKKNVNYWEIEDRIINKPSHLKMSQIWHAHSEYINILKVKSFDNSNKPITMLSGKGWYSPGYGIKESAPEMIFGTSGDFIKTIIQVS